MAFFGYPEAHDNDAERRRAPAWAIITAIAKLNEQPAHAMLSARIGIDSGAVVIGARAGRRIDVFGEAPNLAEKGRSVYMASWTRRVKTEISANNACEPVEAIAGVAAAKLEFRICVTTP